MSSNIENQNGREVFKNEISKAARELNEVKDPRKLSKNLNDKNLDIKTTETRTANHPKELEDIIKNLPKGQYVDGGSIKISYETPEHPISKNQYLSFVGVEYNKLDKSSLLQIFEKNLDYKKIMEGIKKGYIDALSANICGLASNVPTNLDDPDFEQIYLPNKKIIDAKVAELLKNDTNFQQLSLESKKNYIQNLTLACTRGFAAMQTIQTELGLPDSALSFTGKVGGPAYENDAQNVDKYKNYQGVEMNIRYLIKSPKIEYTISSAEKFDETFTPGSIEIYSTSFEASGGNNDLMNGRADFGILKTGLGLNIPLKAWDIKDLYPILNKIFNNPNAIKNTNGFKFNLLSEYLKQYENAFKKNNKLSVKKESEGNFFDTHPRFADKNSPLRKYYEERAEKNKKPELSERQNVLLFVVDYLINKFTTFAEAQKQKQEQEENLNEKINDIKKNYADYKNYIKGLSL